jgi:HAD superfamily hydrolase (TIGR01509 family)
MADRRPVVFDLDGVLVDSEGLSWDAWREVLGRRDMTVDQDDIANLTGRTERDAYDWFAARGDLPPFDDFWTEIADVTYRLFDEQLQAFEDAFDTVDRLHGLGFRMAVASSSPRERIDRSLAMTGLAGYFEFTVAGDEVAVGKPDPEIYRAAAAGLDVAAESCLVVEDSPFGIQAARAAGMRVIAVERGMFPREELAEADTIVPRLTPAAFLG